MHLAMRELSQSYPIGMLALIDVTLDIPHGMFGLPGRNGAGKSTLMRILATLQEPDAGSAWLGDAPPRAGQASEAGTGQGIDVVREKSRVRETLGYLPQTFGFHPRVSAERLLEH